MDWSGIQCEVNRLHQEILDKRHLLCPQGADPMLLLEPGVLARILGVQYVEDPNLEDQVFPFRGRNFTVAGALNRPASLISVSARQSANVRRFTAGHEFGHWLFHPNQVIHRDIPLDGSQRNLPREPFEKEADFFSGCFYIPENALKRLFRQMFRADSKFVFHDANAFSICPLRAKELVSAAENSLERERAMARCTRFGSVQFQKSLAGYFRVSDWAMAIRIRELGLIEWP